MLTSTDEQSAQQLQEATGQAPTWKAEAFSDLDQGVRDSIGKIKDSPFVPVKDSVRRFVFDVATGKLNEVS